MILEQRCRSALLYHFIYYSVFKKNSFFVFFSLFSS